MCGYVAIQTIKHYKINYLFWFPSNFWPDHNDSTSKATGKCFRSSAEKYQQNDNQSTLVHHCLDHCNQCMDEGSSIRRIKPCNTCSDFIFVACADKRIVANSSREIFEYRCNSTHPEVMFINPSLLY